MCILKHTFSYFRKKIHLIDDEISLLKQQENSISISCNETKNNMYSTWKEFSEQVDTLGFSVNKLHNQVISSMTDVSVILTIFILFVPKVI